MNWVFLERDGVGWREEWADGVGDLEDIFTKKPALFSVLYITGTQKNSQKHKSCLETDSAAQLPEPREMFQDQ